MSDDGVAAILRRLDDMEREHSEDMAALGARLDVLTEAHKKCASHCWVGTQEQIKEALRRSSSALLAIPEESHP
jgi:hypothetical protein